MSLRLILKDKGGNWHYVYYFLDPDLGLRYSRKREATEKGGIEIKNWVTSAQL